MRAFIKRCWHQLSSPYYFERIASKTAPTLWVFGFLLLMTGCFWGLFFAPEDYQQLDSFRIIYIHVPTAAWSMGVYVGMAVAAVVYYVWHIKLAAYICRCSALWGAMLTFLALVTGAIWGKPTWGTFWTWDARLTSELILLFLYLGYLSLVSSIDQDDLADKLGSLLLIIGVVNIPIIHYSVVWWNSLHQGATILKVGKPSISADMAIPLYINLFAMMLLSLAYIFTRTHAYILDVKCKKQQHQLLQ